MSMRPTHIESAISNKIGKKKQKESSIKHLHQCPIMIKNGYFGRTAQCSFPLFREMIPCGCVCHSVDLKTCLLMQVPGQSDESNLLDEIIYARYQDEILDEDIVSRKIKSFFKLQVENP